MKKINSSADCSLYLVEHDEDNCFQAFLASTKETRAVCNDPLLLGVEYTEHMREGAALVLRALQESSFLLASEKQTLLLHLLRGGLNFSLREALFHALQWNVHCSAFASAQRQRSTEDPTVWHIVESDYLKIETNGAVDILFADVVATGSSLRYGLELLKQAVISGQLRVDSLTFFTIGSGVCRPLLKEFSNWMQQQNQFFRGIALVFFEGEFAVADDSSPLHIKETGTDLLRRDSLLAPEFVTSQTENPSYPIERCTIYDAGSRSFAIPHYVADVEDYWKAVQAIAQSGVDYPQYLAERYPELSSDSFENVDLTQLCQERLQKICALKDAQ